MQHCSNNFKPGLKPLVSIALTLVLIAFSHTVFAKPTFSQWLQQVKKEALAKGLSPSTVNASISHIKKLPKVVKQDKKQPEFVNTFHRYYLNHLTPTRVQNGRKQLNRNHTLFQQLESQYQIPAAYLAALWGLETNYGGYKGNIDTMSALATLAYDGRRETFFKAQLFDAMWIVEKHGLSFSYLNGSWAGAFGHLQFMPSTFKQYAINGDHNPKIDIKGSIPDAMHSAANYLSSIGWQPNMPSAIQVELPQGFAYQQAQLEQRKTVAQWQALGVVAIQSHMEDALFAQTHRAYQTRLKGQRVRNRFHVSHVQSQSLHNVVRDINAKAAILLPQGWQGPAFMVFDNFDTILNWNRSINYALCVSLLAQQLKDNTVVTALGATNAQTLTRREMLRLQLLLKKSGFDPGPIDGYPGLKTQASIRRYQLAYRLPADGYASMRLYHHLDKQLYKPTQAN